MADLPLPFWDNIPLIITDFTVSIAQIRPFVKYFFSPKTGYQFNRNRLKNPRNHGVLTSFKGCFAPKTEGFTMKYVSVTAVDKRQEAEFTITEHEGKFYLRCVIEQVVPFVIQLSLTPFHEENGVFYYAYCIGLDSDQGLIRDFITLDGIKQPDINDRKALCKFVREAWAELKWDIWTKARVIQEVSNGLAYCDDMTMCKQIRKSKVEKAYLGRSLECLLKLENRKGLVESIKNYTFRNIS